MEDQPKGGDLVGGLVAVVGEAGEEVGCGDGRDEEDVIEEDDVEETAASFFESDVRL